MRNWIRFGLLAAVLSLFAAACGDEGGQGPAGDGTPRGNVKFSVRALEALEDVIDSVQIVLTGQTEPNEEYTIDLIRDGDGVWRGTLAKIYVGTYGVEATAWDADGNVVASAAPNQTIAVTKGMTTPVTIMLHEGRDSGETEFPHFVMIAFDKDIVVAGEILEITVEVTGGEAPYGIAGKNATNPPAWNPPGTFLDENENPLAEAGNRPGDGNGDFLPFTGTTGKIWWMAPNHQGWKWFLLVVEDAKGTRTEVGVDVKVDYASEENVDFEAHFVASPLTIVEGRVLNDNEGTTAYLWVHSVGTAWNAGPIQYEWTTTCGADPSDVELVKSPGSQGWTGSLPMPKPANGWHFEFQIDRPRLDPEEETPGAGGPLGDPSGDSCELVLRTWDDVTGLEFTNTVKINTEWVKPTLP